MDYLDPAFPLKQFTKYFHDMIVALRNRGYCDQEQMFGAGYDWRKLPSKEWVSGVRNLVEQGKYL